MPNQKYDPSKLVVFTLRVTPEEADKIRDMAKEAQLSVNGYLKRRALHKSTTDHNPKDPYAVAEKVAEQQAIQEAKAATIATPYLGSGRDRIPSGNE